MLEGKAELLSSQLKLESWSGDSLGSFPLSDLATSRPHR
jgi:hypothetical protein